MTDNEKAWAVAFVFLIVGAITFMGWAWIL